MCGFDYYLPHRIIHWVMEANNQHHVGLQDATKKNIEHGDRKKVPV